MISSILVAMTMMGAAPAADDYLPLQEGNRWRYRMSNGMEMTMQVAGFAEVGKVRCAKVVTAIGPHETVEYLAADLEGVKAYKFEQGGQEKVFDPPGLRIKLPFKAGDAWTVNVEQGGVTVRTEFKSIVKEQVRTPAGTYEAIAIRAKVTQSAGGQVLGQVEATNWFAPGVGLVRQVMGPTGQEMTAELIEANVKPRPEGPERAAPVVHEGGDPPRWNPSDAGGAPPVAGPPIPLVPNCPKCGAKLSAKAKFCEECGTKIEPPRPARPTACPKCGAAIGPTTKFCADCGAKIEGAPAAAGGGRPPPPDSAGEPARATESLSKYRSTEGAEEREAARAAEPPRGTGPELERYRSADGRVVLFRPKGWNVEDGDLIGPGSYKVAVIEPEENAVVIFVTFPVQEGIEDSVALAARIFEGLKEEMPDLEVSRMVSSPDKTRSSAELTATIEGKKGVGHAYFFKTERIGSMYLLLARQDLWEGLRPTLTAVSANLAYAPEGVARVLEEGEKVSGRCPVARAGLSPAAMAQEAARRPGKQIPLQQGGLPDGSMTIAVPAGWILEGQGLQYIMADHPQARTHGICSVWHTVIPGIPVPGGIDAPYQPPPRALSLIIEAGGVGTGIEVLGECPAEGMLPNVTEAIQLQRAQGNQVDVRILHVRFKSKVTGESLRGMFTVNCSVSPMGLTWQCAVDGGWAPDAEFDEYLPLYLRIGKTAQVNEAWRGREMASRNARQRQLNRSLQNSIAGANQAFDRYLDSVQDASRSRDYQSWAWSQTTLGQGTWVAENEGARVHGTDSWGIQGPEGRFDSPAYNTTNFTGESPWGGQLEQVDTRAEYERHIRGR